MKRIRIESIGVSYPRGNFWEIGSLSHAVHAGSRCLKNSNYHPMDVQVIINSGIYRDRHYAEDDKKLLFEPVQALNTKIRKCQPFFCF